MNARFLLFAAGCCALAALLFWTTGVLSETASHLGLHRSDAVIEAKIARKQAKLAGESHENGHGKEAGPDGRGEWRSMMRAGMPPEEIRLRQKQALKHLAAMPDGSGFTEDAAIDDWTWIGPGNIGGRVRALDIDPSNPNIMHAGAAGGGIWRTTNAGASWYPVNDFLPNLAVVSLARAPDGTLYAGTGEGFSNNDALPGDGIYRSTNNGASWAQLASTDNTNFQFVNRIAVHPSNSSVILVASGSRNSAGRGLYRSTDAGTSWTQILSGQFEDVKFHPNEDEAIAVSGTGNVFISLDGGATWTNETTGAAGKLPTDFGRCEGVVTESFTSETDIWYVSCQRGANNDSEIWRATGESPSWSRRIVEAGDDRFLRNAWYNNALWVSRRNTNDLIVGAVDLWRSDDGGQTLDQISDWRRYHTGQSAHADHHTIVPHPNFDGTSNATVFFGNDGGVQRADDFETVRERSGWTNLANNLGITQFYDGAASPSMDIVIGGAQDNSVLRYRPSDGAQAWFQEFTGDGMGVAVDFTDSDVLYSTTQFLCPRRSTNGGNGWSNRNNGITNACDSNFHPFVAPFMMDPNDNETLYAGSRNLWRTTDEGRNWNSRRAAQTGNPFITAIDVPDGNSNVVWIGYANGQVARSTNGTTSWVRVDNNSSGGSATPPNRVVTDIKVDPANHSRVYVSFGGYNLNSLWMTEDAGATWQTVSGTGASALPAIQINTIELHPARTNWVYVGTDLGMLASEDRGATWSRTPRYPGTINGNEGPVNTEIADLFWAGDRLIAATHGRGMYWTRPLAYIYVDDSNPLAGSGSYTDPFQSFALAYSRAGNGSTIYVRSGTYDLTSLTMTKRVNIFKDAAGGTGPAVIE